MDFVFNFEGSKDEWPKEKAESVVERLKQAIDDEKLTWFVLRSGLFGS